MAFRPIRHARRDGKGVPFIQRVVYTAAQTFKQGALLIATGAGVGTVVECAADPTEVSGVACDPADSAPGFQMANSPTIVTGRSNEVSMILADLSEVFAIDGSSDGTTLAIPLQTNVNESYGVAKDAGGIWYLDLTETTTKVFNVVDFDTDTKVFYVKFLQAVIATAT